MKYVSPVLATPLLLAPETGLCQNTAIHQVPFKIAGGKTVMVKITDQGAVPAENEKIIITATAVRVGPSIENNKNSSSHMVIWA